MVIHSYNEAAGLLLEGKVGLVPSDTLYGISCLASNPENIERIYDIKNRDADKPFIILISKVEDLKKLKIYPNLEILRKLKTLWPASISVVLPCESNEMEYLHRGMKSLAVRIPAVEKLRNLLDKTGPIVSTSANTSNTDPALSVSEAIDRFDDKLDFYLDNGTLNNPPSQILKPEGSTLIKIR